MKRTGLWILVLCLGAVAFADDADNPPEEGWKVVGTKPTADGCGVEDILEWQVGCVAGSISLGKSRPGSMIESTRLQLYAEAPSPALYTPQALTFVGSWSMQSVSTKRTEAGVPRTVHLFDPDGEPIQYDFEDDESMGLPNDHLIDERRFTRLFMVDAEGWATLSEPAYYDLYTHDGNLYRFYAYPDSEHYLELCYYKTASGYEETLLDMGVELIKEDNILLQVLTASRLADIVIESSSKYRVDCYESGDVGAKDTNGFYTVDGEAEPFESWVVENPQPATYENLRVARISHGYTNVVDYSYAADAEEWTMIKGDGMQKTVKSKMRDDSHQVELETYTVWGPKAAPEGLMMAMSESGGDSLGGDWTPVVKRTQRNEVKAFGNVMTQTAECFGDNESDKLVTTFVYYENVGDERQYEQLKAVVMPDNFWVTYKYMDELRRKTEEITPYKSSDEATAVLELSYDAHVEEPAAPVFDARPRTEERRIENILVGKTMRAYEIKDNGLFLEFKEVAVDAISDFGALGSLLTEKVFYGGPTVPQRIKGRQKEVKHPDGQMDSYTYEWGDYTANMNPALCSFATNSSGKAWRETVVHGTTNSPDGITWRTTQEVIVKDEFSNKVLKETYVYTGNGYERIRWTVKEFDVQGHALETHHSDGRNESAQWDSGCCGKTAETDATGVEKVYAYDPLGRVEFMMQLDTNGTSGVTAEFEYDAADRLLSSALLDSGLSTSLSISNEYDLAGRKTTTIDPAGLVTEYDHQNGGRTVAETLPGGADKVVDNYIDGQIKSISGDGVVPKFYDYGVYTNRTTWKIEYVGATNSPQWKRTVKDGADRIIRIEKPAFGGGILTNQYFYNTKGQLERIERPEEADILYAYTEEGLRFRTALDMNENGSIDLGGPDRVSETDAYYEQISGDIWRVNISKLYAEDNSSNVTTTSVKKVRLSGLGTTFDLGLLTAETVSVDIHGNEAVSRTYIDRDEKTVTKIVDVPDSTNDIVTVTVNGLIRSKTTKTGLTYTYQYDSLNRLTGVTDPRTGQIALDYNDKGQVDWQEDAASNKTWFAYDPDTGRKTAETNALGNSTLYTYDDRGQITAVGGSAKYPVEYDYDDHGRLNALYTLRGATNGWDITRWYYDDDTGLVTNKLYDDGNGPSYTYTPYGKLATRTWARGITTDYRYDPAGGLTDINYSDDTPSISLEYNRLGQKTQVIDASGTNIFDYGDAFLLTSEFNVGYASSLSRLYDDLGRASGITHGLDYAVSYTFDDLGRFTSVSSAVDSASSIFDYNYLEDSHLLAGYTNNFGFVVKTGFEANRNLKTGVLSQFGTNTVSSFDYLRDEIGRRSQRTDLRPLGLGFSTNVFGYNPRNELTGAEMGTNNHDYAYDDIGNRTLATNNGLATIYLANELNQYTNITGAATNMPTYDADGNMTAYNGWVYKWNGENRLIQASNATTVVNYTYDHRGRMFEKVVNGETNRFVWDGMNIIAEMSPAQTNLNVWGLDISQSLQGAGGVGGLLAVAVSTNSAPCSMHYACYDANGNITDYVSTNGTVFAHYEYDPYGGITAQFGTLADTFTHRFSTKPFDTETGLIHYEYRVYVPILGRWLSRDSLGEKGGLNLYAYCANNSVNFVDPYGLETIVIPEEIDMDGLVIEEGTEVTYSVELELNGLQEMELSVDISFEPAAKIDGPGPLDGTVSEISVVVEINDFKATDVTVTSDAQATPAAEILTLGIIDMEKILNEKIEEKILKPCED